MYTSFVVIIIMFDFEAGEIVTPYIVHTMHSVQYIVCNAHYECVLHTFTAINNPTAPVTSLT